MNEQIKVLNPKSSDELFEGLCALSDSSDLRVVILNISNENFFEEEKRLTDLITHFPVPIILLLNCKVSLDLVLASHICFCIESVKFDIPNAQKLTKYIGSKNVEKIDFNEKEINAEDALDLGIINNIFNESDLGNWAFSLAEDIVKLAPLAIKYCLKAVNKGLEMDLEKGLELETNLFSKVFSTEDMREGTSAFLEKRKPKFVGK